MPDRPTIKPRSKIPLGILSQIPDLREPPSFDLRALDESESNRMLKCEATMTGVFPVEEPPWTCAFKVKPDPERDKYFRVAVFSTKQEMHDYYVEQGFDDKQFSAIFQGYAIMDPESEVLGDDIGMILLYEGFLGAGVVSHEMTHAAVYWLDLHGVDFGRLPEDRELEERLADVQGELVRQFWLHAYGQDEDY